MLSSPQGVADYQQWFWQVAVLKTLLWDLDESKNQSLPIE